MVHNAALSRAVISSHCCIFYDHVEVSTFKSTWKFIHVSFVPMVQHPLRLSHYFELVALRLI